MRTMSAHPIDLELPVAQERIDPHELLLRVLLYVALWLVVAVLFAVPSLMADWLNGHTWRVSDYVRWSMIQWGTLAVLVPPVLWLAPHEPIEPPNRWRLLRANFGASLIFTVAAVVLGAVITHFVQQEYTSIGYQFTQFLGQHAAMDFVAYWLILGMRQTVHFYQQKVGREAQASRLQAQLAQSHLQLLKMQLHPHFLFNTLHAAATLAREDAAAAEDMLLRLAELLRTYLDDERQEISLGEELELIDLYLGIQRVRFKDRLTSHVDIDPELPLYAVPSLILQPIVENAIQHGIGKQVGADCVEIDCYRVAANLCIDVRNRNSALAGPPEELFRRGIGLSNTRLRLKELYADSAHIELGELLPRGVICRIRLPLRQLAADATHRVARAA